MDVRRFAVDELFEYLALEKQFFPLNIDDPITLTFGNTIFYIEWYDQNFRFVMQSRMPTNAKGQLDNQVIENLLEKLNPIETAPFLVDLGAHTQHILLSIELPLYGRSASDIAEAFDMLWQLNQNLMS